MARPLPILSLLVCLLLPGAASAHKINFFATVDGTTIQGRADYGANSPARGLSVVAVDPAGEPLGETTTDDKGEFRLEARFLCDHRLTVSTVDGHGASCTVSAAELPKHLPPRAASAAHTHDEAPDPAASSDGSELQALRTQIVELRQQLDEHGRRTRMQDVLGAVGYILGIAGVACYFLAMRKRPSNPASSDDSAA